MRDHLFEMLIDSIEEMKAVQSGLAKPARVSTTEGASQPDSVDVARLRTTLKLSQSKFAAVIGVSPDTLQLWEEGRRQPEGSAKVLLRVAEAHPDVLLAVTSKTSKRRRSVR